MLERSHCCHGMRECLDYWPSAFSLCTTSPALRYFLIVVYVVIQAPSGWVNWYWRLLMLATRIWWNTDVVCVGDVVLLSRPFKYWWVWWCDFTGCLCKVTTACGNYIWDRCDLEEDECFSELFPLLVGQQQVSSCWEVCKVATPHSLQWRWPSSFQSYTYLLEVLVKAC